MSKLVVEAGAIKMAINVLKRAGKDEVAEQLENDCECLPDVLKEKEELIHEIASYKEITNNLILKLSSQKRLDLRDFDSHFSKTDSDCLQQIKHQLVIDAIINTHERVKQTKDPLLISNLYSRRFLKNKNDKLAELKFYITYSAINDTYKDILNNENHISVAEKYAENKFGKLK